MPTTQVYDATNNMDLYPSFFLEQDSSLFANFPSHMIKTDHFILLHASIIVVLLIFLICLHGEPTQEMENHFKDTAFGLSMIHTQLDELIDLQKKSSVDVNVNVHTNQPLPTDTDTDIEAESLPPVTTRRSSRSRRIH